MKLHVNDIVKQLTQLHNNLLLNKNQLSYTIIIRTLHGFDYQTISIIFNSKVTNIHYISANYSVS
jgi:hypothetical protein